MKITPEQIVERLRSFFAEKSEIKLVLLYGSAAKGCFNERSDIDIAVAGDRPLGFEARASLSASLLREFDRDIDLIDLNRVEGLILHRAVTQGIRVKTDPALFVRFLSKAYGYQEDFQPLQDMMRTARLRKFIDGSKNR